MGRAKLSKLPFSMQAGREPAARLRTLPTEGATAQCAGPHLLPGMQHWQAPCGACPFRGLPALPRPLRVVPRASSVPIVRPVSGKRRDPCLRSRRPRRATAGGLRGEVPVAVDDGGDAHAVLVSHDLRFRSAPSFSAGLRPDAPEVERPIHLLPSARRVGRGEVVTVLLDVGAGGLSVTLL